MIELDVNGRSHRVDVPPETPLLWVLREELNLTGTKFGCGMALCGACTVHLDGKAIRACVTPVGEAAGKKIVTIEGVSGPEARALERAWVEENVPQCGYCQPGQVMSAVVLLRARPQPTDAEIDAVMSANLCRCGMYQRIKTAIHRAAASGSGGRK